VYGGLFHDIFSRWLFTVVSISLPAMINPTLVAGVVLSLLFILTNGMKDGLACSPRQFLRLADLSPRAVARRLAELVGPFLFGIPVALTVARESSGELLPAESTPSCWLSVAWQERSPGMP